ncbi:MAG: nucleotidyl transferase AbiEii/AbiGii toxin family protein [Chlamydiae bacterium]|nr:nucleotidyl transferase AbiEii/AbiGii toxin family protein [Chlamydiota bacterium]MBI3278051.1 nucleotidyl transferase AbiEii/AbiGii toxin family protein [Chlamydiota bacterium]
MLTTEIERLVQNLERQNLSSGVIQNHIKEYLQLYVLDFIYNSRFSKAFIFTGGTCLAICYGLNRLSEDIDFDLTEDIDIASFAKDLHNHFIKKLQHKEIEFAIKGKNDKLYLKFPILHRLGLSDRGESDKLYVKIETSPVVKTGYKTEFTPVDRERLNFLVQHYDLPSLMAGKINALFHRIYFKGKKNEITFKGRDVYDFIWYLQRGVHPNMVMIGKFLNMSSEEILFEKIREKIIKYKPEHLLKDLENLFDSHSFIKNWVENSGSILDKYILEMKKNDGEKHGSKN